MSVKCITAANMSGWPLRPCWPLWPWPLLKQRLRDTLVSVGPRLIVQLCLLAAFLYFFGFPAVARFAKKGVVVVETEKDTDGIPFPAITLSAVAQITNDTCFNNNESIEDCIEANTLNCSDILKPSVLGFRRQKEIDFTKDLTEDFTSTWAGRYFTLRLPINIGPNPDEYQLYLGLNKNLTFYVFVHDPDYFFYNYNEIALPSTLTRFETTPQGRWVHNLELTEVNKLNLPSSPCNDDPDYNFQSCLRRSISEEVFCFRKILTFSRFFRASLNVGFS